MPIPVFEEHSRENRSDVRSYFACVFAVFVIAGDMFSENTGTLQNAATVEASDVKSLEETTEPTVPDADTVRSRGESVFGQTCVFCHQTNGLGLASQFPPLAGSEWVQAPLPDRLIRIVLHGLAGPIKVKGQKWDVQMPPFGPILSDEDVAAVLTYVRQSWDNQASSVKPAQVKAIRDQLANRDQPWSAEELLQVPADSPAEN